MEAVALARSRWSREFSLSGEGASYRAEGARFCMTFVAAAKVLTELLQDLVSGGILI